MYLLHGAGARDEEATCLALLDHSLSLHAVSNEKDSHQLTIASAQVRPAKEQSDRPAGSPMHAISPNRIIHTLIAQVEVRHLVEGSRDVAPLVEPSMFERQHCLKLEVVEHTCKPGT